jgi:putative phosphoesterase
MLTANVRIGIISDIHTNAEGLRIALDRMGDVDELLCAGDIVYQYRFGNEVIETLRERGARNILGNHDCILLGPQGVRARSAAHVRADNLEYLQSQPLQLDIEVAGKRILMAHGSPFEPFDTYLYPRSPELQRLAEIDRDYIILGHTHFQMSERIGTALVINPGSVGEARDDRNGRLLSYAILDLASGEVTFDNFTVPKT